MRAIGYAYPWDYLDDPAAAPRAAALGLRRVALAAAYHATRTATPTHPRRRVRELPHAALYTTWRDEVWRDRRLAPREPTWLEEDDAFGVAATRLAAEGLGVEAWIVLTHEDGLGLAHPDVAVRNAFGDAYSYGLCPHSSEVREYCATLAAEVVATTACEGVVLEACGPMGFDHEGVHEKTEFARWGVATRRLLSLCFCAHSVDAYDRAGLDVDDLARRVREGVLAGASSVEGALGDELAMRVGSLRAAGSAALRREVLARVRASRELRVTLHASGDPWTTGSFCAIDAGDDLDGVDALVASAWDPARAASEAEGLVALARGRAVGAYFRLDRGWDDAAAFVAAVEDFAARGVDEAHLYHLGLLSERDLGLVAALCAAVGS